MRAVRFRRRLLAAPAASIVLLGATASPALAQTTTGQSGPSLSPAPPVQLGGGTTKKKKTTKPSTTTPKTATGTPAAKGQLPNTGYDAVGVALLGAGLMLGGVGLRLRTRDVRWP